MMRRLMAVLLTAGALGCAMLRDPVMISPQGNFLVFSYSDEKANAIAQAEYSARAHCKEQRKLVKLLSEVTVYQGPLTEEAYELARTAGKVAEIYGHGDAGYATSSASSRSSYKTTVEFQCQ